MIYPDKKKFIKLAQNNNLIPVYCEYFSDMLTPVSAFSKITDTKHSFILESVESGRHVGRYSLIGSSPSLVFSTRGRKAEIKILNKSFFQNDAFFKSRIYDIKINRDPLHEIKDILKKFNIASDKKLSFVFSGGFIGYIGYDVVNFFEAVDSPSCDDINTSDCFLMLSDSVIIFDHLKKRLKIVKNIYTAGKKDKFSLNKIYKEALSGIKTTEKKIFFSKVKNIYPEIKNVDTAVKNIKIRSNFKKSEFVKKVQNIKDDIKNGQIIQAVLSQRFKMDFNKDSLLVYRYLRAVNPSPYMFLLKTSDISLIGSSPEVMVRSTGNKVELRPIAGTRPRGENEKEDLKQEKELLEDEKEKAEHIMLVDLGRNDLGRVCKYKSVIVPELMLVEKYSHVLHIVSSVKGILKKGKDMFDLFRACFPAGTVTGAPKIKAMQIISRLEKDKRGPYAGSVGYFSFAGCMDTCITIRTVMLKNNTAYIQAGAGIVADSVPEKEYDETVNKAKALLKTIHLANEN